MMMCHIGFMSEETQTTTTRPQRRDYRIDALLNDLVNAANEKGITKRSLATMAKVHFNTLLHFKRPGWAPSPETIRRLERVLLPPGS